MCSLAPRSAFKFYNKLNNVFLVFSRCHPGTLGDAGVRLLQLQLGERAHQPQRHRALLWRERQAAALLRHVEERLRDHRGRQARLLAGRCQLLRQVRYRDRTWRSWSLRRTPARQFWRRWRDGLDEAASRVLQEAVVTAHYHKCVASPRSLSLMLSRYLGRTISWEKTLSFKAFLPCFNQSWTVFCWFFMLLSCRSGLLHSMSFLPGEIKDMDIGVCSQGPVE